MNILIVGNGFDLSHYLPTKYDHFMVAMDAIENWNDSKGDMGFDDFFGSLYEKEDYFFGYTKAMYHTDEIKISANRVKELKEQLKDNVWYQYFSDHVKEVKTWIDFEQKIEEVLLSFAHALSFIEKINYQSGSAFSQSSIESELGKRNINILKKFGIFENKGQRQGFNAKFCYGSNDKNGLNPSSLLNYLQKQLEEFIEIFNLYLELVISRLLPIESFSIDSEDWIYPNKIFSFNYTNTYQRIHDSVEVDYLHGSHGEEQNIVLGVSDLEDESLKKIKAYGFTKYHQKLFKDTDYLFLDGFKEKVKNHEKRLEEFERDYQLADKSDYRKLFGIGEKLNLKFFIWGHSLDVSDKDYILDLFSLNDGVDRNVRVTIYYFNKTAKFDLLNNLLAILGKDKVEHWMKNKWLQFKENPKIVPKSAITLDDLPQT